METQEIHVSEGALEGSLDALYEKRASTRETGLKGLTRILAREVATSWISKRYETVSYQSLACIKKGGSSEIALAARVLGLLVLTLGYGDAALRVKEEVYECLLKVAKLASSSNARVAALEALAIVTFVCNERQDTKDAMAFMWEIISHDSQKLGGQKPPDAVVAAALSGWTLLLSSLPSCLVSEPLLISSLPALSLLLRSSDLTVRKAAGEAAATLNEAAPDFTDAENDCVETSVGEVKTEDVKDVMQEVLHEMKNLSVVGNDKKFQNQKDRRAQRKSFRQLLLTLDDGVPREVKVKIPKCKVLTINTWSETIQLNRLQHYLGDKGFQAHMQGNTLLHEIFGVELEEKRVRVCDMNLSRVEKKMLFSPNSISSKARTKQLNRSRLSNQVEKAASFNVNGYESD